MLGGTLTREEGHADVIDPLECQKLCEASPECEYFTIRTDPANPLFAEFPGCWLKSADSTQAPAESGTISGYKCCGKFTSVCFILNVLSFLYKKRSIYLGFMFHFHIFKICSSSCQSEWGMRTNGRRRGSIIWLEEVEFRRA